MGLDKGRIFEQTDKHDLHQTQQSFFLLLKDMPILKYFERLLEGKPKLESWMSFFWGVLMDDRVQSCDVHLQKKDCLEKGVGGCGYGYGCY